MPLRRRRESGFTLIEILVVTAVIGILLAIGAYAFRSSGRQIDLQTTSHEVVAALHLARARTLASKGAAQYGVHFEGDKYVFFTGPSYNPGATDNDTHQVPSNVEIYNISVGGGSEVIFDRVTGTTASAGTVSLRLVNQTASTSTVSILASGLAGLSGTVAPTGTRVTDSRHLHFDLGWSIQNSTTLTLLFSDPTVQEDIIMDSYFNADKSAFDWQGTISVDGEDQTLRVYTHALDAANTELSIRRDRRENSKAVTISIIIGGEVSEIVSYAADGTAVVGSDGGTMTEQ